MSEPVWSIAPIRPEATASRGAMPNTCAEPSSGASSPSVMSIVVDLPAPFGPSRATVSPAAIETSTPRTACTVPCSPAKDFVRPLRVTPPVVVTGLSIASIMPSWCVPPGGSGRGGRHDFDMTNVTRQAPWHFLYFLPDPHQQGSLRPSFV